MATATADIPSASTTKENSPNSSPTATLAPSSGGDAPASATASPNSSSSFSASKATATVIVVPDHASSTPASASHNGAATASGERKMMTNLTKRPPALLQYTDLVYTVREKSGKFGSSWFATKTILKGKRCFDPWMIKIRSGSQNNSIHTF